MSFFTELKRRNVFKVGAAYAIVAWLLIQITDIVAPALHLPEWTLTFIIYLLVVGFPIALFLAWAFELTPEGIKPTHEVTKSDSISHITGQKLNYIIVGLLLGAILTSGIFWFVNQDSDHEWASEVAIPRINQLIAEEDYEAALKIANEIEERDPNNQSLEKLFPTFTQIAKIESKPSGATVYRKGYSAPEENWEKIGTTPIQNIRVPNAISLIRIELEGYQPLIRIIPTPNRIVLPSSSSLSNLTLPSWDISAQLDTDVSLPKGKVRIPGWSEIVDDQVVDFKDFFLGKYEVTNREYKVFVDNAGYQNSEYWEHPFVDDGVTLSITEAISRFVDKTGRPGPSTWIGGTYPTGQDDFPVAGVSWYEAVAYAKFIGQELPTVYHWRQAVFDSIGTVTLPVSNLDGNSAAPVGEFNAVNWAGNFDMTGNVREWVYNEIGNQRVVLGGGWNDSLYYGLVSEGTSSFGQNPMDRSETNGFRVAIIRDPAVEKARKPLKPAKHLPDWKSETPVSDDVFNAYQRVYEYDNKPLNEEVEETVKTTNWVRERISFDAAYDKDRVILVLYLPPDISAPYQTVVWWPGADALFNDSINTYGAQFISLFIGGGRALAIPVLKDTFERRNGEPLPERESTAFRELTIKWVNDIRRSLDYLETRADIDTSRFAYFGTSWGGANSPNVLALEKRFSTAILVVGGMLSGGTEIFQAGRNLPEVYALNSLPRVTLPILMLNGEFDNIVPLEASAKPFFEMLGTPESDKKLVIAKGGHSVPRIVLAQETLDWLDKYLGKP